MRVTVTLDPADLDWIDRLAALEGKNRSEELRTLFAQLRPGMRATVLAMEAALKARDKIAPAAMQAAVDQLAGLLPDAEGVGGDYLAAMARIETLAVAADVRDAE